MATELHLRRFCVQNYKSVNDSGWIDTRSAVTPLLGKNEAGKSVLLKALYKLNPVDDEPFVRYVSSHVGATPTNFISKTGRSSRVNLINSGLALSHPRPAHGMQ